MRFIFCALFLLSTIAIYSITLAEIHRARGIRPPSKLKTRKETPRSTWPPGPNIESLPPAPADNIKVLNAEENPTVSVYETKENLVHVKEVHSKETWIYSMLSACLVGLSGIFPLLVIPLESGESLKHGAAAARLKLLLSFAVGGLLGDVFLHLLPEAWSHLKGFQSHKNSGVWILIGLCAFLVVEKIFPEEDDEDNEEDETKEDDTRKHKENVEVEEKSLERDMGHEPSSSRSKQSMKQNSLSDDCIVKNGHSLPRNGQNGFAIHRGKSQLNGHLNGHSVGNGVAHHNGAVHNGSVATVQNSGNSSHRASKHHEKSHIKTSGWLNLMANVIDNFTHGLAVAGSYCVSTKVGLLTTFAILLHEIPHEVGDFAILLRAGFDRWKAAKAQVMTASGGLIGALCALMADSVQEAGNKTAWVLPFTAGGFIYIALVTVVPDLVKEKNNRESVKQLLCLFSGIAVMALVTLLFD